MTLAHVDLILDGVHVLVVEDNIDAREAIRTILQYCGALVTTASSTAEAHRSLEILRPHVLVTDVGMPHDGLRLIRAVKAMAQAHGVQIPTIAMTDGQSEQAKFWAQGLRRFSSNRWTRWRSVVWYGDS